MWHARAANGAAKEAIGALVRAPAQPLDVRGLTSGRAFAIGVSSSTLAIGSWRDRGVARMHHHEDDALVEGRFVATASGHVTVDEDLQWEADEEECAKTSVYAFELAPD